MDASLAEAVSIGLLSAFLGGAAGIVGWLIYRRSQSRKIPARMLKIMRRLGVDAGTLNELNLEHPMRIAMRLCRHCRNKGECDAWLATHEQSHTAPAFCSNLSFLHLAVIEAKQKNKRDRD